jgi:hypothetical protein
MLQSAHSSQPKVFPLNGQTLSSAAASAAGLNGRRGRRAGLKVVAPLPYGRCIYYESATIAEGDAGRLIQGDVSLDDQSSAVDPRSSDRHVVTFVVEGAVSPKFISPNKKIEVLGHIVGICRDDLGVPWMACSHFMTPIDLESTHAFTAPISVDRKYELVEMEEVEFVRMSAVTGWRHVHCCSKHRFYDKHIVVVDGDAEHTGGVVTSKLKKITVPLTRKKMPASPSSLVPHNNRNYASPFGLFSFGTNEDSASQNRKQKAYFSHILFSKRSRLSKTRRFDAKS